MELTEPGANAETKEKGGEKDAEASLASNLWKKASQALFGDLSNPLRAAFGVLVLIRRR